MQKLRLWLLLVLCLALSCTAAAETSSGTLAVTATPLSWDGQPLVRTHYGLVQGDEDADGTWLWRAIPFARPPVGQFRWRAPQPPEPWGGVRHEKEFNQGCTQYGLGGRIHGAEDCLYLNIWRPRSAVKLLPVYVWIHGGGNSIGSATIVPDYYGNRLAGREGLVFISINYRLGPFGWFTHPALREGASPEDASGNYGTLDIIQGLRWVRENIAAFGGDPANVTIAGESAGGFNVLSLLISPFAAGLFQRAVCESGVPLTSSREQGDEKSAQIMAALRAGRPAGHAGHEASDAAMTSAEIRNYLRARSDREILACYQGGFGGMIDNPAIFRDGRVIPADGFEVLRRGDYANKVPLIIGSNREEIKLFLCFMRGLDWRGELYRAAAKYGSRLWKAVGVDEVARRLRSQPDQPPVYVYEFAWGAPDSRSPLPGHWDERLGACHSLEISFFLGTDTINGFLQSILLNRRNKPGREALSRVMMAYVAQFARTGDPNAEDGSRPLWRPWAAGAGAPKGIVFDAAGALPALSVSMDEYNVPGVYAALEELPEPLRSQTRELLRGFGLFEGAS